MQSKRILIPINLQNTSFDALLFARKMIDEMPVCLTLLNVVPLNIAAESRAYEEMCRECDNELRRIADRYFGREQAVSARVRVGKPCEQIVAEATSGQAELILLSSPKCSPWKRWYGERTVEGVVRLAPCPTLVLPRIWKMTPEEARHAPRPADAMKSDWLTTAPA